MLGFVRSLVVMFNANNLDRMEEVLRWKVGEYDTILGDLNARVNNHVQNNVFGDITRTTNNATNIRGLSHNSTFVLCHLLMDDLNHQSRRNI